MPKQAVYAVRVNPVRDGRWVIKQTVRPNRSRARYVLTGRARFVKRGDHAAVAAAVCAGMAGRL